MQENKDLHYQLATWKAIAFAAAVCLFVRCDNPGQTYAEMEATLLDFPGSTGMPELSKPFQQALRELKEMALRETTAA